jgi:hypothetical protein
MPEYGQIRPKSVAYIIKLNIIKYLCLTEIYNLLSKNFGSYFQYLVSDGSEIRYKRYEHNAVKYS